MIGKLYFCCGLPRSGKTRFCETFVSLATKRVAISGDSFRTALTGQVFNPFAEGVVFAAMDIAIRALLADDYDVIVDETCTTVETIKRWYRIDLDAEPCFFDTPEEVCIERAVATGKDYLIQPIKRIAKQYNYIRSNWISGDNIRDKLRREVRDRNLTDIIV